MSDHSSHHTANAPAGALPGKIYRPCAGILLVNAQNHIFVGQRCLPSGHEAPEAQADHYWQMPQGGIDAGESPVAAARRELHEETGIRSANLIGLSPNWHLYDFPAEIAARMAPFDGQRQKWVAFRFVGEDMEIDITGATSGHTAEFASYRWMPSEAVAESAIPFKRDVYRRVIADFSYIWRG